VSAERYLAFDCGSSTGRVVAGNFDGRRLSLEPIYSFPNRPVVLGGRHYWDIFHMFGELKNALRKASDDGFKSISVDSWGSDFVLIGHDGSIMQNLSCYRDGSLYEYRDEVNSLISSKERYRMLGVAELNTSNIMRLYQLKKTNPSLLDAAAHFLQIADAFNYLLSGELRGEYTLATTSQLIDPAEASWNEEAFSRLDLPYRIAPPLTDSGTLLGRLAAPSWLGEDGINGADVIAACCHDSAAAMLAMPLKENDVLYVSSGTWSVVMLRIERPILTPEYPLRFMHEGNWGRRPRLAYNLIGLWLVQQLRRESDGLSYEEMEAQARVSEPFARVLVPEDDPAAFKGGVRASIADLCDRTGQPAPQTAGDYLRAIYDTLALSYRALIEEAEGFLGYPLRAVCVAGGGAKSALLCEATAEATGLSVTVGPSEAAVVGNIIAQMAVHGEIGSIDDAPEIMKTSFGERHFEPSGRFGGAVESAIETFEQLKAEFLQKPT